MPAIEASGLTKVYHTYRKERGLWGSIKGLVKRRHDETQAADDVSFRRARRVCWLSRPERRGQNYRAQDALGVVEPDLG